MHVQRSISAALFIVCLVMSTTLVLAASSERSLLILEGENHLLQGDPREALRSFRAA